MMRNFGTCFFFRKIWGVPTWNNFRIHRLNNLFILGVSQRRGPLKVFFHEFTAIAGASTVDELVYQLGKPTLKANKKPENGVPHGFFFVRFCWTKNHYFFKWGHQLDLQFSRHEVVIMALDQIQKPWSPKGQGKSRNVMEALARSLFRESWVEQKRTWWISA